MSIPQAGKLVLGGRYELQECIGSGGMAEVYRAQDGVLGRDVAVKLLNPERAADPAFLERFRREARAAARLNHPNIVAIYDWGSPEAGRGPDGDPRYDFFIVMEYVAGGSLAVPARRGPLPEVEALGLAAQIAAALEAAHLQGVVHRDIKPQNVLLTPEGQAKVADFGIARASGVEPVTHTSEVLGSAEYLSPEQAQGKPVDARSDLYSLGAVLYHLLTGRPPFEGDTAVAVAVRQVREPPEPPRRRNPAISPAAEAIVLKLLAKDPDRRFQSAAELRGALLAAQQQIGAVGKPARAAVPPTGPADPTATRPPIRPRPGRVVRPGRQPPPPIRLRRRRRGDPRLFALPALLLLLLLGAALTASRLGAAATAPPPGGMGAASTPPAMVAAAGHPAPASTTAAGPGATATARPAVAAARAAGPSPAPPAGAPRTAETAPPPAAATAPPPAARTAAPSPAATPVPAAPVVAAGAAAAALADTPTASPPAPAPAIAQRAEQSAPATATAPPVSPPAEQAASSAPATQANGALGPAQTVVHFYTLVGEHQFAQAAQLWSPAMQAAYPPAQDLDGRFAGVQEMLVRQSAVTASGGNRATVAVDVVEVDGGSPPSTREYVGTWQLVAGPSGWLLDQPNLRQVR